MTFNALATDFDGTIAHDGHVDEMTLAGLERVRNAGCALVLVTGRELTSLTNTFSHLAMFQRVVLENGAVLFDPSTKLVKVLGPAPPAPLVQRLNDRNVPLSVGYSIIATVRPHEHEALEAIRELGLEWHIVFNKGAVMMLSSGITKATGLRLALEELNLDPARTIAVGDAENDQSLLEFCGLSVAVSNALESVKQRVDLVTNGERGAGVVECIDRWLSGDFEKAQTRRSGPSQAVTTLRYDPTS